MTRLAILPALALIPMPEPLVRTARAVRARVCAAVLARIDARLIRRNEKRG